MIHCRRRQLMWLGVALCLIAQPAAAITIHIDYGYDTNNFFGSGNPQGVAAGIQAKAAMEAAASYFSGILTDSFSAIQTPVPYHSSVSNGVVTWSWQESFTNPTTGSTVTVIDPTVAANQYIVYAGARSLSGSTAGIGAAGAYAWSSNITGTNSFSQSDINQINAITANFQDAVERRGQSGGGFARWGGVVSFDTSSRTWHYDYTTLPSVGETDFYSVAIHELAHSLGFGESNGSSTSAWGALVDGSTFTGINAESQYGGSPVPLSADKAHWAVSTTSVVYGTSIAQEASMDPDILSGTRKRFTALDAAAMKDIGWDVTTPPGANGDYNNNGIVDAADYVLWRDRLGQGYTLPNDTTPGNVMPSDYTVWRNNFGATSGSGGGSLVFDSAVPEPASAVMMLLSGIMFLVWRKPSTANAAIVRNERRG